MTHWPETLELTLDAMAQGGEAVGRWQERVVFARGGLPGERVRVALREYRDSYARGAIVEVIEASPDRVAPRLPGADHMPWQHIAYPAQLRFKRQILADQLAKIGGLADIVVEETLAAARPWGYRNSARLHGDGARIGYYAAESRDLQPIETDPLLLPALNDALLALHSAIGDARWAPAEVLLRASEAYGYVIAALRGPGNGRSLAGRWRMRCPPLAGVLLPGAPGASAAALGADHLMEELGGVAFQLQPATFFQVNVASAETLLELTRAALGLHGAALAPRETAGDVAEHGAGGRLLDLYCGAGTFTLPLAAVACEVVGIEEFAGAVEDGRITAARNGIDNVHFEIGRVEAVLPRLDGPFAAVVLDPPRRGCHPKVLEQLIRLAPSRIVYVACHPATLARDLKLLIAGGYRIGPIRPVDLFPQTAHIESVSVLVRDV